MVQGLPGAESKRTFNGPGGSPKSIHSSNHYKVPERETANADKAILNLMKEHNKLKKRLEVVS